MSQRVPFNISVSGSPALTLFIHPSVPEIGIRAATSGPPIGNRHLYRGIRSRTVHVGTPCDEIVIVDDLSFRDGYTLLCAIADRVQLDGESLAQAAQTTIRNMARLLARAGEMSREAEIGLFGELCVLRGICQAQGTDVAVQAWLGQAGEEHDFRLTDFDVEVKTTAQERRRHWISGSRQLEPTGSRQLWLVSVLLTLAPAGGGVTIGALHQKVRQLFSGANREQFDAQIEMGGWSEGILSRSERRWSIRYDPLAFLVDASFPRITASGLSLAGLSLARIPELSYLVDVDGMSSSMPVVPQLSEILEGAIRGL